MNVLRLLSIVATAVVAFAVSINAATVGERAPEFSLVDSEGKTHRLEDYAGKIVVLEWTNYGCPYVKKYYNIGDMQKLQAQAKLDNVVWLTVCSSAPGAQGHMSAEEWQSEAESRGVAASILLDEDGKVGKMYNATTTPHMYVIDENGVLAYNGAIDSIRSTKSSDIAKATNYVVDAYTALQNGQPIEKTTTKPYGCGVKYATY